MAMSPETVAELHLEMVRGYATKEHVYSLQDRLSEIENVTLKLNEEVHHILDSVNEIRDTLRWTVRIVLGTLLSGVVGSAAYFLANSAGVL